MGFVGGDADATICSGAVFGAGRYTKYNTE